MPTENRSSNTEMVSVPEGFMLVERSIWTEKQVEAATACITRLKGVPTMTDRALAMAAIDAAQCTAPDIALSDILPAPQPHPEPIAWMVGTAFWWTKDEAERDAAETRLPIVGLGPMTCIAPAQQHHGEPVVLPARKDPTQGWAVPGGVAKADGWNEYHDEIAKLGPLYTHADPAEVERLRAALKFYADREHYHFESGNWDTVSGEPLNILWCGDEPDFIEDGAVARNALAASAEPSASAPFQARVEPWLLECFGEMIAGDREERNHRLLEEALELVQALGATAGEAHQLVDYVFGRAVGEPSQEVGGVMVTLASLCLANGLDMHQLAETELARIWTKVEQIRAKQASKPQFGPLPGVYPDRKQ